MGSGFYFGVDARRSDAGHLAGFSRRRPGHPTRHAAAASSRGSLRTAGTSLIRPSSDGPRDWRQCQAAARPARRRTGRTGAQRVLLFLVVGDYSGSCSSRASGTSMRSRKFCFSDQRVARVGRLGISEHPGINQHMTVSRDGRWALATKMVRFDADLMRSKRLLMTCSRTPRGHSARSARAGLGEGRPTGGT